jgi:uncharacterized DUF497 family protein
LPAAVTGNAAPAGLSGSTARMPDKSASRSCSVPPVLHALQITGYSRIIEPQSYKGELPVQFEWDADKAALNLKKHGVRFETAARVFYDENRIELYESEHSIDEDRYNTIGMVDNILFVVYTERKNRIRLISARPANSKERSLYYDRYL